MPDLDSEASSKFSGLEGHVYKYIVDWMIISLSFLSLGDKKKKGEEAALPELSDSEAEGEGAGEKACKLEFKASVSCSLWVQ